MCCPAPRAAENGEAIPGERSEAGLRSRFYANDVMMGKGPKDFGGSPASFRLYVANSDELFDRVVGAGAIVQMPMADQLWGDRAGCVADPNGYNWWIATRKEDLTPSEMKQRADDFFKQMAQARLITLG